MAFAKLFPQFEEHIRKIDVKIKNENLQDLDNTSKNLLDLKTLLSSSLKTLDQIDSELSNLSQEKQREYISKRKIFQSDYETRRNNILKIEEKYNSKINLNKLTSGTSKLSKSEAKKIERDAVLDFDRNVNYQKDLLDDIGKDLTTAHSNLTGIVTEVKNQGETINRIQVGIKDAETSVKRADKNITTMQRRVYCQKCLLHVLAIMLFMANCVAIIYKLLK